MSGTVVQTSFFKYLGHLAYGSSSSLAVRVSVKALMLSGYIG
jgi:hypothetical protein